MMMDGAADLGGAEERRNLPLGQAVGDSRQPVAAAAGSLDEVAARAQRVEPLEQLRSGNVELVAEHGARDEIVVALEQHAEDESVLAVVGPMREIGLPGGGRDQRAHARASMSRLKSTAGAECVRAPTDT